MKKTYLILIICILTVGNFNLNAQNDKNEKTWITLFRLPSEPLPKDYTTYQAKAITLDTRKSAVMGSLKIYGLVPKSGGGADVILEYVETPLKLYNVDIKTVQHEETVKGVKKVTTAYYAEVQYQHAISFSASDKTGKQLINKTYYDEGYRTVNTQEYSSYAEAKKNYEAVAYGAEKTEFEGALSDISNNLLSRYSVTKYNFQILICSVKPKKFNYDSFNKATAMALVAFHQLDSLSKLITDLKGNDYSVYPPNYNATLQMFRDAIQLWQEELKESSMTDKKARIDKDLTYDLDINIGVSYMMLKDFKQARKYINDALAIKGTWAGIYDRELKDLQARFHANYPDLF